MRIKQVSIVLIVILAGTLFLGGTLFTYHGMKTILVPAIACGLILLLGLIQLGIELTAKPKTAGTDADSLKKAEEARQKHRIYLMGFGWLIGYALAIYLIGFIYGTFLFIFLFVRFNGKRSWFHSVAVAVLLTALFWVSFVYLLQTALWGGAVFDWLNLNWLSLTQG